MTVKAFNIKWDTKDSCGGTIDIPAEMVIDIPDNIWDNLETKAERSDELEIYIADKISDVSGFCHDGFDYEIVKKKFHVPFQTREIVWNNCVATVEANTKAEAFEKVKNSDNPFFNFDAEWDGCNTVTTEVVETEVYNYMKEATVEDVKEVEKYSYQSGFEILDLLKLSKDTLYKSVEEQIPNIEKIFEMDIIPIDIKNQYVILKFIPREYKE